MNLSNKLDFVFVTLITATLALLIPQPCVASGLGDDRNAQIATNEIATSDASTFPLNIAQVSPIDAQRESGDAYPDYFLKMVQYCYDIQGRVDQIGELEREYLRRRLNDPEMREYWGCMAVLLALHDRSEQTAEELLAFVIRTYGPCDEDRGDFNLMMTKAWAVTMLGFIDYPISRQALMRIAASINVSSLFQNWEDDDFVSAVAASPYSAFQDVIRGAAYKGLAIMGGRENNEYLRSEFARIRSDPGELLSGAGPMLKGHVYLLKEALAIADFVVDSGTDAYVKVLSSKDEWGKVYNKYSPRYDIPDEERESKMKQLAEERAK
ncbi:MAG: hypothetical protein GC168_07575 [Candidatus Hydrogenedens sp.]|nr:hypothetical protein [Candidatus Hydrogenedens sp.]